jgi:hypothetical protein
MPAHAKAGCFRNSQLWGAPKARTSNDFIQVIPTSTNLHSPQLNHDHTGTRHVADKGAE